MCDLELYIQPFAAIVAILSHFFCTPGNKLADQSKLKKLQQMSNNEFGFSMDTLITAERRNKLLKSVLKQSESRQNEIDKMYKKFDKPKITKRERDLLTRELEELEEKQSKSVYLHLKYVSSLDNVIVEKKAFYIAETIEKDRQNEEKRLLEASQGDNIQQLIAKRYGTNTFNNYGNKTNHNEYSNNNTASSNNSVGIAFESSNLNNLSNNLHSQSTHSYLSLANKLVNTAEQNNKPSSGLPNPYSIYAKKNVG